MLYPGWYLPASLVDKHVLRQGGVETGLNRQSRCIFEMGWAKPWPKNTNGLLPVEVRCPETSLLKGVQSWYFELF